VPHLLPRHHPRWKLPQLLLCLLLRHQCLLLLVWQLRLHQSLRLLLLPMRCWRPPHQQHCCHQQYQPQQLLLVLQRTHPALRLWTPLGRQAAPASQHPQRPRPLLLYHCWLLLAVCHR
jgi:hypothetical protein